MIRTWLQSGHCNKLISRDRDAFIPSVAFCSPRLRADTNWIRSIISCFVNGLKGPDISLVIDDRWLLSVCRMVTIDHHHGGSWQLKCWRAATEGICNPEKRNWRESRRHRLLVHCRYKCSLSANFNGDTFSMIHSCFAKFSR